MSARMILHEDSNDANNAGGKHTGATVTPRGHDHHLQTKMFVGGKLNTPVLTRGILTLYSFPEGMAVGVSFAKLSFEDGMDVFDVAIPLLAIYMAVALSIQNIPEWTAIDIPIHAI